MQIANRRHPYIIFTFTSVNSTVTPGGASHYEPDKIRALAANTTWRDFGAPLGTVTGGLLLSGDFLFETFAITTFIPAISLLIHFKKSIKK